MMLQDISPKHLDNQYKPEKTPRPEDFVLIYRLGRSMEVLANMDNGLTYPTVQTLEAAGLTGYELQYLFSIDAEDYYILMKEGKPVQAEDLHPVEAEAGQPLEAEGAVTLEAKASQPLSGYSFQSLREFDEKKAIYKDRIFAAHTGKHLVDWYRDFTYCGRCGTKTIHSKTERAKTCPSCGYTAYPRIMPAVIVGVTNGDTILITKYRTGFNHSALIAGFTEIGETMEETVQREVMEEAGIKVKNVRYYKSQPWGIANDILLGYYCEVDGNDEIHMDKQELKYAEWVHYDDIEFQPGNFSLTNEMMKHFAQEKGRWIEED